MLRWSSPAGTTIFLAKLLRLDAIIGSKNPPSLFFLQLECFALFSMSPYMALKNKGLLRSQWEQNRHFYTFVANRLPLSVETWVSCTARNLQLWLADNPKTLDQSASSTGAHFDPQISWNPSLRKPSCFLVVNPSYLQKAFVSCSS